MKIASIAEIHVYAVDLPILGNPYKYSGMVMHQAQSTVVKLVDTDGLVGWGEACPLGATYQPEHFLGIQAALEHLAPLLIGHNARTPMQLMRTMNHFLNGHNSAKAAIDIAGWDLLGKALKLRVCDVLGGSQQVRVPSYYAIGLESADETARIAVDKIREGYRRIQLKIGSRTVEEDAEVIRAVYEVSRGKAALVADANRSLTSKQAITLCHLCKDVSFSLEQPCHSLIENESVRQRIQHPLFLDENLVDIATTSRLMSNNACDGLGLKLTRLGGLHPFSVVRDVSEANAIPITCDDTFGGDIIAAACVHGGATVNPRLLEGVWVATTYVHGNYGEPSEITVTNGSIDIPTGPGLGVTPNEAGLGAPRLSFG